jgi:hypothetical protein
MPGAFGKGTNRRLLQALDRIDLSSIRFYANREVVSQGSAILFSSRTILMVLITMRLLLPPGICVCKWSSPAARMLVALVQSEHEVPIEDQRDDDDDHDAGCPASPLAAGMGVKPPTEPLLPPGLSLDPLPQLETSQPLFTLCAATVSWARFDPPHVPVYLTLRALLV